MKILVILLILLSGVTVGRLSALAAEPAASPAACSPDTAQLQDSSGVCAEPPGNQNQDASGGSLPLLFMTQDKQQEKPLLLPLPVDKANQPKGAHAIIVYFFRGKGCPHCEEEKRFLEDLKRKQPALEVRDYEVWYNKQNAGMMGRMLQARGIRSSGVPVTFIHRQYFSGFTGQTRASIEKAVENCAETECGDPGRNLSTAGHPEQSVVSRPDATEKPAAESASVSDAPDTTAVTIPVLGTLDTSNSSLPLLTILIAGLDSFNPCAFFVLLSLLGLLVHAQSRNRMLLIGGIFVFFSGFIYFLFMAAWLNLFLVMGRVALITTIAGGISVFIAVVNIKDFFLFKKGLSLSIPDSAKPKLFDRMRRLLRSTSLLSIIIGTTVLAIVANFYELLCTAGFPMVFTRILTLNRLSPTGYYLYLVLYNVVYIVPLSIIVLGFTFTLGKRKLSEWQGRLLKLVSGSMMLGLGGLLLINPALLGSVKVSSLVMAASVGGALLVAAVTKRITGG